MSADVHVQSDPLTLTSASANCNQTLTCVARVSGSRKSGERFYSLTCVNSRVPVKFTDPLNKVRFESERGALHRTIRSGKSPIQHVSISSDATMLNDSLDCFPTAVSGEYFFGLNPHQRPNPSEKHVTFLRNSYGYPNQNRVVLRRPERCRHRSLGLRHRSVQVDIAPPCAPAIRPPQLGALRYRRTDTAVFL